MKIRLDRWLTSLGEGSRSQVKKWITDGAVAVDGRTAADPAEHFETETSGLAIAGRPVDGRLERHLMMNKPAGVLTAARDKKQRTVMDLVDGVYRSVGCMPAGRLDMDTTGLLLLTTDGELNHRLLSPGRHVAKRYRAEVTGRLTEDAVRLFASGMELGDFTAKPAELSILSASDGGSLAEVVITEGKYHQVKRMFSAAGHEVTRLERLSFGPLELDPALGPGEYRELSAGELAALRRAAGMEEQ